MADTKSKVQSAKSKVTAKSPKVTKAAPVKAATSKTAREAKKEAKETVSATAAVSPVEKKTVRKAGDVSVKVLGTDGKVLEEVKLPGDIFAAKVNPQLMAQAVRVYLANQRTGTRATKGRGEVDGSTRKIYRQKGTGRARHGAVRAPLFVGGGVTFAFKPQDYSRKLPQKMRRAALFSALSSKLQNDELKVVSGFAKLSPKTKEMAAVMKHLDGAKKLNVLLVLPSHDQKVENVTRASRNLPGLTYTHANQLHTYEVLKSQTIIFMKEAVESLEKTLVQK